jgi:thymidylate synthase (FAD)
MTLEINTTRDIARQILRHRSFSFQEFSQRYADPTKDLKFVTKEARMQDTKNRQNSLTTTNKKLQEEWEARQQGVILRAQTTYEWAIKNGIAKEQARAVLPEGCTMSRLYMAGTIRSWIHYCDLRRKNGTQLEHQRIAEHCWEILKQEFPSITDAIEHE